MTIEWHLPLPPLQPFVEHMLYIEGNNKGTGLPKTAMSLVFNLADHFRLFANDRFEDCTHHKRFWVAGLQAAPSYVESYGNSRMWVIQFWPLGAFAFFSEPLHLFSNAYTALDDVYAAAADRVWHQIGEAPSRKAQLQVIQTFLQQRLLHGRSPAPSSLKRLHHVVKNMGSLSVESLCTEAGITRKHLNHLFQNYIGVSPKTQCSLFRFKRILQRLSNSKPSSLTSFAYDENFFDQAHFNNDFKRLSGLTPYNYLRQVEAWPSLKLVPHFLPFGNR